MSIFEYVSVAISIILGLGLAQLLLAALDLFRFRATTRFHWIPLFWALDILWIQLEFWWNLFGIRQATSVWTHGDFLLTVAIAISLFAASSLILPKRWTDEDRDLAEFFHREGKWGVGAFVLFHVIAIPFNYRLFDTPFLSWLNLLLVGMIAAAVGTVRSRTVRGAGASTLVFLTLQIISTVAFTLAPAFSD